METTPRHILFYSVHPSYDAEAPEFSSGIPTDFVRQSGQNALTVLLRSPEIKFSRLVLLYRSVWEDLARKLGSEAESEHGIHVEYMPIPSIDVNSQEDIVDFYYNLTTTYPFNYKKEDYYLFSDGLDFVTRIYLYYLSTVNFLKITVLTLPYADNPDKICFSTPNLNYYGNLSEKVQQRKADGVNRLKNGINTQDSAFNRKMEQLELVALSTLDPILLSGPTGTGKTTLARRIYELRHDKGLCPGRYVEISCAAVRDTDAHSLLFGHVPGAFPGVESQRNGLLRLADNGAIYLGDIGYLGLQEQALLLRAMDDGYFYPKGSDEKVFSNFMLVCSTNQNLMVEAQAGRFRHDLLARINLWHFSLPPLRERLADIPPNLDYELEIQSRQRGVRIVMTPKARESFLHYAMSSEAQWISNFRSFSAIIRRMCVYASQGIIDLPAVEEHIWYLKEYRNAWERASDNPSHSFSLVRAFLGEESLDNMDYFDCSQLESVLNVCIQCRNLADAGRRLFSHSRLKKGATNDSDRIRKYLARYNLTWADINMMHNQTSR